MTTLEDTDKILVLMLCGCGAELNRPVIGDTMILTSTELPVDETLIMLAESSSNQIKLLNPILLKEVTLNRQEVKMAPPTSASLCLPS